MRILSRGVSYVFHPLFLYFYLVLIAFAIDKYDYRIDNSRAIEAMLIMTFFILVMFPLISTFLFKGLGLIPDLKMADKKDRIGPLIATLIFYIWYFVNVKNNVALPDTLRFVALGGAIALGLAFFINNFSRISLHAVGAGTFLLAIILLVLHTNSSSLVFTLPMIGSYRVSSIFVIFLTVIISGLIGTSRLYLEAHTMEDVFGGYVVGIFSQIVAYNFMT
jgi:membrane-associated phospholipid phosphatase